MRLRHIEVVVALMRTGTLSGAATVLGMSPSAVSKVLQHAELQLGLPLFARSRGRLSPSLEARRLFPRIEEVHLSLQTVHRLADNLSRADTGALKVAICPALADAVLPEILNGWHRLHPHLSACILAHESSEAVTDLLTDECQFAIALGDPSHPRVSAHTLGFGFAVALAPRGTWNQDLEREDLSVTAFPRNLCLSDGEEFTTALVATGAAAGASLKPWVRVRGHVAARAMAYSGAAVSIVDSFTAAGADPTRTQKRTVSPRVQIPVTLLTLHGTSLEDSAHDFVNRMAGAIAGSTGHPLQ